MELVPDPSTWTIILNDGSHGVVLAHSHYESNGMVVFELLFEGEPVQMLEVLRVPEAAVREVFSVG